MMCLKRWDYKLMVSKVDYLLVSGNEEIKYITGRRVALYDTYKNRLTHLMFKGLRRFLGRLCKYLANK